MESESIDDFPSRNHTNSSNDIPFDHNNSDNRYRLFGEELTSINNTVNGGSSNKSENMEVMGVENIPNGNGHSTDMSKQKAKSVDKKTTVSTHVDKKPTIIDTWLTKKKPHGPECMK